MKPVEVCARSADSGTPAFQAGGGGAHPTLALFDGSWRRSCRIAVIDDATATSMILQHYLGKWPAVVLLTLGMWRDEQPLGVVVFAAPPRETMKRYGGNVWELARLWIADEVPRNAESWLLAQAARYVRRRRPEVEVLVSYADPSRGHQGGIYRAAGWRADGWTVDATGKRYSRRNHIPNGVAFWRVARQPKYRFFLRLRASA
jgi:hypothetical protein